MHRAKPEPTTTVETTKVTQNQTWKYWKIRLDPSLCTQSTQFLFVLRPHQSNYAAFVDYTNAARPCCWVHLPKRMDFE